MTDAISRKTAQSKLHDMAQMLEAEMPKDEAGQRHVIGFVHGLRQAASLLDLVKAEAVK